MSKKQETISDIVAEMRRLNPEKFLSTPWYCEPLPNKMRSYADRIEAAAKSIEADRDNWRRQALDEDARANAATIKDALTVGNAAAMREALNQIRELLSIGGKPDTSMCIRYEAAYQIAKEALSAPPRNCDVGTAEEQAIRHKRFCDGKGMKYCWGRGCFKCFAAWEQIPYEEEAK